MNNDWVKKLLDDSAKAMAEDKVENEGLDPMTAACSLLMLGLFIAKHADGEADLEIHNKALYMLMALLTKHSKDPAMTDANIQRIASELIDGATAAGRAVAKTEQEALQATKQ